MLFNLKIINFYLGFLYKSDFRVLLRHRNEKTMISFTVLIRLKFKGSRFKGSRFKGSRFKGSRFKGSRFKGSRFKESRFKGSRF